MSIFCFSLTRKFLNFKANFALKYLKYIYKIYKTFLLPILRFDLEDYYQAPGQCRCLRSSDKENYAR